MHLRELFSIPLNPLRQDDSDQQLWGVWKYYQKLAELMGEPTKCSHEKARQIAGLGSKRMQ